MAATAGVMPQRKADAPALEKHLTQSEQPILEERIRRRAYEIYLKRCGQDGSALNDWLQAEQEIESQKEPTPSIASS